MPRSLSFSRALLKAGRFVLPSLLLLSCASAAEASPQSARAPRRRLAVCDPRTTSMRRVMGNRAALGPIADRSSEAQAGLTDTTAQVRRATRARLDESEEAAIQNDAPAAPGAFADDTTPLLRPIGVLSSSFDRLPATTAFSPRSPRGPPFAL
jgi:hypothetical protein